MEVEFTMTPPKKIRTGWSFNDGTAIFIGHLPGRKQECVYVEEGSVVTVLAYVTNEYRADILEEYHRKLASGSTE